MHVAWMQCSENPPLAYRAFVANCNCTRSHRCCGAGLRIRGNPCRSRDSVRAARSQRAGRSVLPESMRVAGALQ
ncbi:hypothetical protein CN645_13465 [Burkholderia sp. IDO3]|nr:hypothetical protein CN645_13465 [Burkholderia sp. IDO3]